MLSYRVLIAILSVEQPFQSNSIRFGFSALLMKAGRFAAGMTTSRQVVFQPAAAVLLALTIIIGTWAATFQTLPPLSLENEQVEPSEVGAKLSDSDVDVQVLYVGDRWTYDGFFDVAEMITNSGVETDAEALTGELEMWVDDVRTTETENHSTVMYRIKSEGVFIAENVTLSGTLGDITIDFESTEMIRAGDLAVYQTVASMHVKFWISATSFVDVANVEVTDTFFEPNEVYDFPLRVGETWTNDYLDVNWWNGGSNFFTIPEDETLSTTTNHSVVSVGDPNVEYSGCGNSYNVSTFDENNSVSAFRWWCPSAKTDAWRHYKDAMGIYVDFFLKDFQPATPPIEMEVDLEYPTWALNMQLGVWINVTDSNNSPVSGMSFVLRYEFVDLWVELTTDANGMAYYSLNTSDPLDSTPSNHDYASHGIVAYEPVNEYVGVDTLTLDDELVNLDYRPRPGGISVSRDRGNESITLNPLYGFNAIAGDELHFIVPIENKGTNGGPATEMEMTTPDGVTERKAISALPPVGEDILQYSWIVPASTPTGLVSINFEVDPDQTMTGDVNLSNNLAFFEIFIGTLPVVDLEPVNPTLSQTEILLDASGSMDADGGSIHCSFEVEITEGITKTFEESDCQMFINWSDDGLFHIDLTITDEENDRDETSMDIQILNRVPWVNVTSPELQILAEEPITFDAFDSGDADTLNSDAPLSFLWEPPVRSDGVTYECEEGPITMHCTVTPLEEGVFTMKLHGTDDDGDVTTGEFALTVGNIAPRNVEMVMEGGAASNSEPAPEVWVVDEDQEVTLRATAIDSMNDQDSLTWDWQPSSNIDDTWSEVTSGSESEISTTWTISGDHIVQLEVTDDDGISSGVHTGFVTVQNVPPTSQPFGNTLPVGEDRIFTLTGLYSDTPSDVDDLQVCWDINLDNDADDNLVKNDDCDYIGDTIEHSWPEAGIYTIRFHVTDDDGDVAESLVNVTVVNLRPKAGGVAEKTTVTVGEEVVIWTTDTTDTESDMSLLMYIWDLDTTTDSNGDGDAANDMDSFSSGTLPFRHTFETPGTKQIRLIVTDEEFTSTKDFTIFVTGGESDFLGAMGETAGISNVILAILLFVLIAGVAGFAMSRKGDGDLAGLVHQESLFDDESGEEMDSDLKDVESNSDGTSELNSEKSSDEIADGNSDESADELADGNSDEKSDENSNESAELGDNEDSSE